MSIKLSNLLELIVRYSLILLAGLFNLSLFYFLFSSVTFYSSAFILRFFGEVTILSQARIILFNLSAIEIVNACIAGSAYYLLFILVLSTRKIDIKRRTFLLLSSFLMLLIANIMRIVSLTLIVGKPYFTEAHMSIWYLLSTVFVVLIWFANVKLFKIKNIPIYSDIRFLIKEVKA